MKSRNEVISETMKYLAELIDLNEGLFDVSIHVTRFTKDADDNEIETTTTYSAMIVHDADAAKTDQEEWYAEQINRSVQTLYHSDMELKESFDNIELHERFNSEQ